jgi:hypothetical protein
MTRLSTRLSPISLARASAWGVGLVGLVPVRAFACSVCGGGNPANRFAFFASTIALSLLPLGLFAAGFLWLRARGASEFVERDAARPALVDPTSRDNGEPHPPPVPAA